VSTAKGIAYALEIPLLSCGTLENMAHGALHHHELIGPLKEEGARLLLCPMLDARRMEVYSCFYTGNLEVHREVSADIITEASYRDLLENHHIYFFGNGSDKCSQVITHPNAHFIEGIDPAASQMITPVWKKFSEHRYEDVAYFEPYYLKDFVATIPRKKVL
jgi:tRNA threonylcarbamoyladenosine biosynthesis protein TsaB